MVLPGSPGGRVRRRRLLAESPQDLGSWGLSSIRAGGSAQPRERLPEGPYRTLHVSQLVEAEKSEPERLKALGFITHEGHTAGYLETRLGELAAGADAVIAAQFGRAAGA